MIPAYDARPEKQGRYPIVVAISGFTGVSEHHKDVVRRFAHAGYYAIAPELYHREGGMQGKNFQEMSQISGKVTRKLYLGDITAAADYAKQQSWARADRIGATGFCGGGALALHFSAEYPGVAAAVPWYGHLKRTFSDAPGVDAFSLIPRLKTAVLGLYGEADGGIAADDVRRFDAELKKVNANVEFVLYPGAPHAFFSDDPAAGLQEGGLRGRLEALPRVLRQTPQGVTGPGRASPGARPLPSRLRDLHAPGAEASAAASHELPEPFISFSATLRRMTASLRISGGIRRRPRARSRAGA